MNFFESVPDIDLKEVKPRPLREEVLCRGHYSRKALENCKAQGVDLHSE